MTSLLETDLEATRLQLYALLMTQAKQLGHLAPQFLNLSLVLPDNLLEGEARLSSWPLKDATALLSPDAALE